MDDGLNIPIEDILNNLADNYLAQIRELSWNNASLRAANVALMRRLESLQAETIMGNDHKVDTLEKKVFEEDESTYQN